MKEGESTSVVYHINGCPNVLPVDDLGIKKAIQSVYSLRELPKKEKIVNLAEPWHPYCSVASLYLWRHKDGLRDQK